MRFLQVTTICLLMSNEESKELVDAFEVMAAAQDRYASLAAMLLAHQYREMVRLARLGLKYEALGEREEEFKRSDK